MLGIHTHYILSFPISVCQTDGVGEDGLVVSHFELLKVAPLVCSDEYR